ncbi:MAG: hypothetical protein FWF35_02060 [Elusimicrobia bacterium]|nr:hypothetical protein [Elusimicrobiota bacterium]
MKKIINLVFAAVLFMVAAAYSVSVYAACSDNYHACRCKQYTGGNFSSLGVGSLNDCCTYRQQGCDVGTSFFTGTGLTFDSASGKCKTPCPSSCSSGQSRNTSVSFSDDGSCCITKTPCSNFWSTKKVGLVTTPICNAPGEYPSDWIPNQSCAYLEDGCDCCQPGGGSSYCTNNMISSAANVCSEYGTSSTQCICANGNQKQCAGAIYGPVGTTPETQCIQNGATYPYCNCTNFTSYWYGARPNWQDMACIGLPAKCTSSGTN